MRRILLLFSVARISYFMTDALPGIFDQTTALGDRHERENTAAVYG
jgi:hypothetical protein